MNIVIAFHVPISTTPAKAIEVLDKLFKKTFGDQASRIILGHDLSDELMYLVNAPIIFDTSVMEDFFEKLLSVFTSTIEYIPHFTQPPKELFDKDVTNV